MGAVGAPEGEMHKMARRRRAPREKSVKNSAPQARPKEKGVKMARRRRAPRRKVENGPEGPVSPEKHVFCMVFNGKRARRARFFSEKHVFFAPKNHVFCMVFHWFSFVFPYVSSRF